MLESLNYVMRQMLLWKILMKRQFSRRGIEIRDLDSEVSQDIVAEPVIGLGKVIVRRNVRIGKGTYIGSGIISSDVSIGRYCSIAYDVLIAQEKHPTQYLTTFQFSRDYPYYREDDAKRTIIGNDVWVGANSFIRRGISIADGAIIGAGAVVLKSVPPYAIVAGVPAKVIRYRFDEATINKLLRLKWWNEEDSLLASLDLSNVEKCIEVLSRKGSALKKSQL